MPRAISMKPECQSYEFIRSGLSVFFQLLLRSGWAGIILSHVQLDGSSLENHKYKCTGFNALNVRRLKNKKQEILFLQMLLLYSPIQATYPKWETLLAVLLNNK